MRRAAAALLFLTAVAAAGCDEPAPPPGAGTAEPRQAAVLEAIRREDRAQFEALLRGGANLNESGRAGDTAVHAAARHEDPWWLLALLQRGGDPNVRNPETGSRPIMDAVQNHRDAAIALLLRAGADPNATNNAGDTALHVAAATNHARLSLLLLNGCANPRALNSLGHTFQAYQFMPPDDRLNAAIRRDRAAIRDWLRQRGVPVDG